MSRPSVGSTDPAAGWRQRGYNHGIAKRKPQPPDDPEAAAAYMDGFRTATRVLESRGE